MFRDGEPLWAITAGHVDHALGREATEGELKEIAELLHTKDGFELEWGDVLDNCIKHAGIRAEGSAPIEPPSEIPGLRWTHAYGAEPHDKTHCGEDDCEGQTCQYNALCANCEEVLGKSVHIYCASRKGVDITLCSSCFFDCLVAMKSEGGWKVDGTWDLNFTEPEGLPPNPESYVGPLNKNGSAKRSTKEYKDWARKNPAVAEPYKAAMEAWHKKRDEAWKEYLLVMGKPDSLASSLASSQ